MQPTPIRTAAEKEYDNLVQTRISTLKLLEKIDKKLSQLRGQLKGKY
jgi:hypothetical protein